MRSGGIFFPCPMPLKSETPSGRKSCRYQQCEPLEVTNRVQNLRAPDFTFILAISWEGLQFRAVENSQHFLYPGWVKGFEAHTRKSGKTDIALAGRGWTKRKHVTVQLNRNRSLGGEKVGRPFLLVPDFVEFAVDVI